MRQQFGSSAYSQFRQNYSEQDIFSGSDVNQILEQMARAFGLRGFDEIFKEFYGKGYRHYEFRKPGFFAKSYYFSWPRQSRDLNAAGTPLQGSIGKLTRFFLKQFSGIELPEDGTDLNDTIRLSPEFARQGGPYAYYLRKKDKKLVVKIPPAVKHNQQIRLAGMGEDGKGGGKAFAREPLHGQVATVSVGIYDGETVLDLDYAEDSQAETDLNVVMNEAGGFVEVQGTAEGHAFRRGELDAMLDEMAQAERKCRGALDRLKNET